MLWDSVGHDYYAQLGEEIYWSFVYYLQFFENEKCEQKVEINLRLSSYSTPKMVKIYNLELIIFSLIKSY